MQTASSYQKIRQLVSVFLLSLAVFASASSANGAITCESLFSERTAIRLGQGDGGEVVREYRHDIGFVAKKTYFDKERLQNDLAAWSFLRRFEVSSVRLVPLIFHRDLIVETEFVEGPTLSNHRDENVIAQYENYVRALKGFLEARVDLLRLDIYANRVDGLSRLNAKIRGLDGRLFHILIRPENFIVTTTGLVLIDPH